MTPLQAAASCADESLVALFLGLSVNVNTPARGGQGYTALQAICIWDSATEMEHHRQMRIYSILINGGADVNAGASPEGGFTALGAAAIRGDLEMAVDLLSRGARVNARWVLPWALVSGGRLVFTHAALDVAAAFGRLDMVKLLLNANALSAVRGSSGYEGAIEMSQKEYPVVAESIREHAKRNLELGLFNWEMLTPPEECNWHGQDTMTRRTTMGLNGTPMMKLGPLVRLRHEYPPYLSISRRAARRQIHRVLGLDWPHQVCHLKDNI